MTITQAAAALGIAERRLRRLLEKPEYAASTLTTTRRTRSGTRQAVTLPAALLEVIRVALERDSPASPEAIGAHPEGTWPPIGGQVLPPLGKKLTLGTAEANAAINAALAEKYGVNNPAEAQKNTAEAGNNAADSDNAAAHPPLAKDAQYEALSATLEVLRDQLAVKDGQLASQARQIESLQEAVRAFGENEQKLRALELHNQQPALLEAAKPEPPPQTWLASLWGRVWPKG